MGGMQFVNGVNQFFLDPAGQGYFFKARAAADIWSIGAILYLLTVKGDTSRLSRFKKAYLAGTPHTFFNFSERVWAKNTALRDFVKSLLDKRV